MSDDTSVLDLSDEEIHARLVGRNVDADLATLLVVACRAGDTDALATLDEIIG